MSADAALGAVLADLEEAGRTWPCRGREEWLADDAATLAEATQACGSCPALEACALTAIANPPTWGAWAGEVFALTPSLNRAALDRLRARYKEAT